VAEGALIPVQLLFAAEPPPLDRGRLHESLRARLGAVRLAEPDSPGLLLAQVDDLPRGDVGETAVPTSLQWMSAPLEQRDALHAAAAQTWDWPEAEDAAAAAAWSVFVMSMLSWSWLHRSTRLRLLHAGVEASLDQLEPLALHWPTAERLVSPAAYRRVRAEEADRLYPAANVRMFTIKGGRPGETLMDTVGLAPLGLPDLQLTFSQLEPNDVAGRLADLALYLFTEGDVIESGHTTEGVPPGSRWVCRRTPALAPPEREAIELAPAALQ
jgi:hypothetical protein